MRRRFIGADAGWQRFGARAGAPIIALPRSGYGIFRRLAGQCEIGLAATDQFQINLGEDLAVLKRAVLFARRVVDAKAAAQGI